MLRRKYSRYWWLSFVLSCFPLITPTAQSAEEAILRGLVEQYFSAYVKEDIAALGQLWSASAFAARQKELEKLFAEHDRIEVRALIVRQCKAEGERARLRVMLESSAVNAKTGKPANGFGKQNRSFHFVRENNQWKLQHEEPTEEELAHLLTTARTTEEKQTVLQAESEFWTESVARFWLDQVEPLCDAGKFPEARARLELASLVVDFARLHPLKTRLAMESGSMLFMQGEMGQALPHFNDAARLAEAAGDKRAQTRALNGIAVTYQNQGDFDAALDAARRSLSLAEALQDKALIAKLNGTLSVIYVNLNRYDDAAAAATKGKKLALEAGDKSLLFTSLQVEGEIHLRLHNYQLGLITFQQLTSLADEVGFSAMSRMARTQSAMVYRRLGDYDQALRKMQEAQQVGPQSNQLAAALEDLQVAYLHHERGDTARALELARRALQAAEGLAAEGLVADVLWLISTMEIAQGRYREALETSRRALTLAQRQGDAALLIATGHAVGKSLLLLQEFAEAETILTTVLAQIEQARQGAIGTEETQQRFFEDLVSPYYDLLHLHARKQQPMTALSVVERSRARALLDLVRDVRSVRSSLDKALSAAEKQEEAQLRAEAARLTQELRASTTDAAQRTALQNKLQQARLAYEAFQFRLYTAHPELRAQRGEAPVIKPEELTALLPDHQTALLEFAVADDTTYLFVITRSNQQQPPEIRLYPLPITRAELTKQTDQFRQQLAALDLKFRPAAKQLYESLLQPAQVQLAGKTRLIIVPDGKLWELPFQALVTPQNRYLIETAAISYAPSLTVLREMQTQRTRKTAAPNGLLAFGNPSFDATTRERTTLAKRDEKLVPLPEAEAEIKALGQLYGIRSKVYIGAAASEDKLKAEAANARILHFATHGILNDTAPMYSHLAFALGNKSEDGLLEAWELLQMDLQADLAVLSACETARGRIGAGEGVIGLSWALFVAGVPSTVVSQWKVESSSTRDLMLGFHRSLKGTNGKPGTTKAEALRQAVLPLLKSPRTDHPFYWAGFVLVGDGQ